MAGKGAPELTVDDLESSGKLQGKNLLELVKAPKPPADDTFTLSQSSNSGLKTRQVESFAHG